MVRQRIAQYRILERLGHGGMGSVFRATDEMLGREVALKVLNAELAELEEHSERFRGEAAALARLTHPGIATVHELLQDDDRLVIVMELVRGQTLQRILEQAGVFTPQRAAALCMQVLAALAHAHAAGVVHRDLKPSNLVLTETGAVKILDFGIARLEGSIHLTGAGCMMGTPAFMAPEQVLGLETDARTDLYAMGVVFYRLISGEFPFKAGTSFAMAQSQVNDPPTPIDAVRPHLPSWVSPLLARALAKEPERRFQSATEFYEAFASCRADEALADAAMTEHTEVIVSTLMPPVNARREKTAEVARRRMATWIGLAVGGICVVLFAWSMTASTSQSSGNPENRPRAGVAGAKAKTADVAPVLFSDVKLLSVAGRSTSAASVILSFEQSLMRAISTESAANATALSYERIAGATYVLARDPRWNPRFRAPASGIDVPGFLGRSRHWLTVQTKDSYAILRLDGPDWSRVLKTFETRTGVTIDRPGSPK